MAVFINFSSMQNMDSSLIPNEIYNETINKEKNKIEDYFILNPSLLKSFVGFNGALKLANQLSYNKKCGCFYKMPWKTYYSSINNTNETIISFSQQVELYRYMISFSSPSPEISYLKYLSDIALDMMLVINQFLYYRSNNLEYCTIYNKKYYSNNFKNNKLFINYINLNFLK